MSTATLDTAKIQFPRKLLPLFLKSRYKCCVVAPDSRSESRP